MNHYLVTLRNPNNGNTIQQRILAKDEAQLKDMLVLRNDKRALDNILKIELVATAEQRAELVSWWAARVLA